RHVSSRPSRCTFSTTTGPEGATCVAIRTHRPTQFSGASAFRTARTPIHPTTMTLRTTATRLIIGSFLRWLVELDLDLELGTPGTAEFEGDFEFDKYT